MNCTAVFMAFAAFWRQACSWNFATSPIIAQLPVQRVHNAPHRKYPQKLCNKVKSLLPIIFTARFPLRLIGWLRHCHSNWKEYGSSTNADRYVDKPHRLRLHIKQGVLFFHTLMAKEAHKQADSTCGHSHQATRTRMTRNHQHQDECTL